MACAHVLGGDCTTGLYLHQSFFERGGFLRAGLYHRRFAHDSQQKIRLRLGLVRNSSAHMFTLYQTGAGASQLTATTA